MIRKAEYVNPGDTLEVEDGFSLFYFHVERIEVSFAEPRRFGELTHYTFYGHDGGDDGELYAVAGESMEVVTFPLERFGSSITVNDNPNPSALRWQVYADGRGFMYADTLGGAVDLARELEAKYA